MAREAVKVNVYDMTSLNAYMGTLGIGIYHCGLQIYNRGIDWSAHFRVANLAASRLLADYSPIANTASSIQNTLMVATRFPSLACSRSSLAMRSHWARRTSSLSRLSIEHTEVRR